MKTLGRIVLVLVLIVVGYVVARYAFAQSAFAQTAITQSQLEAAQVRADNAETRVKELVDNPIVTTKVVTQEVKIEVPIEKIVEIKVPVTETVTIKVPSSDLITTTLVSNACRHVEWFTSADGALQTTTDVAGLVAKLDRDFQLNEGGEWSNMGFTVPAGSVFWTDLFQNAVPKGVEAIRRQGGWGVYKASVAYTIPDPNGGGRFVRICEGVTDIKVSVSPVASASSASTTAKPICVTATEVAPIMAITDAVAQGKAYDTFFEKTGWQYGKAFQNGDVAPAGWLLHANSKVYKTVAEEKLAEGGRGMPICK